jgi:hypothetical protein
MHMRRLLHACGALTALAGGLTAGSLALLPGTASAAPCTSEASCAMTGTATLTGGTLSLSTSGSLSWAGTLTGVLQSIADTSTADQTYTVNDATGSSSGWNVTVSATTFTTGTATLPDTGTFSTNGDPTSVSSTTAPTATCTGGTGTCTLPTESGVTYPVAITTAATAPTAVTVYNATSGTGLGSIDIGSVGWWLTIPGTTTAGTYTSSVTMAVSSGPGT